MESLTLDTNVLVRILVRDDEVQYNEARKLLETYQIIINVTVLLETAWVLEHLYHLNPPDIINAIEGFQSLPNVDFDDNGIFSKASPWVKNGMETADAFHLAAAHTKFATFDRKFATQAEKNGLTNVLNLSQKA